MKKIIVFKIDKLLSKYRLSQRRVSLECNIRPTTMKMYVDNSIKRINLSDLENLYNFFYELDDRFTINDLIDIKDFTSQYSLRKIDIYNEYKQKD
jgi:hypothetical protein